MRSGPINLRYDNTTLSLLDPVTIFYFVGRELLHTYALVQRWFCCTFCLCFTNTPLSLHGCINFYLLFKRLFYELLKDVLSG
jgi:hypothetical protein